MSKKYKDVNDVVVPMLKLLKEIIKDPKKEGYSYIGVDIFGQDFLSIKETFSKDNIVEYLEDTCNPGGILGVFIEKCFQMGFCVGYARHEEAVAYKDDIVEAYKKMLTIKNDNTNEDQEQDWVKFMLDVLEPSYKRVINERSGLETDNYDIRPKVAKYLVEKGYTITKRKP